MKVLFIILVVCVILLVIPIQLKINFKYDVMKNRGFFEIVLWVFKIKFYRFRFKGNKIILKNRKETKEIDIEINIESVNYANELQKQIFKRLFLKDLILFVTIGSNKNSSEVALIGGLANTLFASLKVYVITNKPTANFIYKVYPQFDQDNAVLTFKTTISISITNIVISLLRTKFIINKKKEIKNGKRKRV